MDNQRLWHKCWAPWWRRTIDGNLIGLEPPGQCWRRLKDDGTWEYKLDRETEEEFRERMPDI